MKVYVKILINKPLLRPLRAIKWLEDVGVRLKPGQTCILGNEVITSSFKCNGVCVALSPWRCNTWVCPARIQSTGLEEGKKGWVGGGGHFLGWRAGQF